MACCGSRKQIPGPRLDPSVQLTATGAQQMARSQGLEAATTERIERRIQMCRSCPYRVARPVESCNRCGCVLVMKIGKAHESCPALRW